MTSAFLDFIGIQDPSRYELQRKAGDNPPSSQIKIKMNSHNLHDVVCLSGSSTTWTFVKCDVTRQILENPITPKEIRMAELLSLIFDREG